MKNGFSLIELIITISIMGLIGTVLYPNFTKIQQKAKATAIKNISHTIQMATESYYLSNGAYPSGSNIPLVDLLKIFQKNGEMNKIPINPYTGKSYTSQDSSGQIYYTYTTSNEAYKIQGYGANNANLIISLENI